ncbi:unnamed protein product [Caenorhabditis sp. 36 PRJEB53466]|nr:unnamed protein product [Caenorhabditis sp. 36 PRJEB53466]
MQRRTTIWFLLLFQPILVFTQNQTDAYECKIGSVNPLASPSLNVCFKLYDTPKSYQAARRHCVSLGGQLAEKINKDDSSLYSANADLEVTNATQFWVGASNLKCNIGWENGGEIEFNELWAPESRYYGVAIDKMSLGGLWHTVPVGRLLPFVCTFQGKPKNAPAPVHAMRAPAKKRPAKTETPEDDDIDEDLNAALSDERTTTEKPVTEKKTEETKAVEEAKNATVAGEKKTAEAAALSAKSQSESNDEDSMAESESASISDQQAMNASAASASASASESSDEIYDASETAIRKEMGYAAAISMSQDMAAQSESFDQYTEADLLSAAASLMGGYTVNANWADSSTRTSSTFDSQTDEMSMSQSMSVAEQRALAMEMSAESKSESSDSSSDSVHEEASMSAEMAKAMSASEMSKKESASSSNDKSADSASMSVEQKAVAAAEKEEKQEEKSEDDEMADLVSAAAVLAGGKKTDAPKGVIATSVRPTTEGPQEDIDDSLNAALSDQRSTSITTTKKPDLTNVITTAMAAGGPLVGAARPDRKKNPGCPAEWTQFNTNVTAPPLCFRRFDKPMNFEDARVYCLGKGGHLASIHNERQLLLLSALLHNNAPDGISNQTWIGLNRIHQKYYVYEDETAMDFTRWLPGAPNINDCTVFTGNELPNYPHKGTQYKFGDFPCEEAQKSVLCEVTLGNDKDSSQPTCQEGWSYYSHDGNAQNGKCYKHIEQAKKFTEGRQVCRQENAYVASVQNDGEARFVSALVQTAKNFTMNEQTWIGYVKYDKDFGWEDGNKGIQFDPWTEKLPRDKKCTVFTGNEIHDDCRSKFKFVSVDCNTNQRAVLCSKPPMKDGAQFVYKDTENTLKPI